MQPKIKVNKKCIVSFNDSSLINSISIIIPSAFRSFFDNKDRLQHDNCSKITNLFMLLERNRIDKYRFVPTDFEENSIKAINKLIGTGAMMLKDVLMKNFKDQFKNQINNIILTFREIETTSDIEDIKNFFIQNERNLTREENIPEDSDLSIMEALSIYKCDGYRFIVSFDEHF